MKNLIFSTVWMIRTWISNEIHLALRANSPMHQAIKQDNRSTLWCFFFSVCISCLLTPVFVDWTITYCHRKKRYFELGRPKKTPKWLRWPVDGMYLLYYCTSYANIISKIKAERMTQSKWHEFIRFDSHRIYYNCNGNRRKVWWTSVSSMINYTKNTHPLL